jgi:nitric oxide reductase NorQ protein
MSTRQRMVSIDLDFPGPEVEHAILVVEAGISDDAADGLIRLAQAIRRAKDSGLREVASTRTLIAAGALLEAGLSFEEATMAAIVGPLTDDLDLRAGLVKMIESYGE